MTDEIEVAGESVRIRADGSLYWPARRLLAVADLHFGKSEAFRAGSIPVPGGPTATLDKLDTALIQTGAERLIVLGDFWHAREGRTERVLEELANWRTERSDLQIELVRGNHDRAGPPPEGWAIGWEALKRMEKPFCFAHHPEPSSEGYVLCGHLHPGIGLAGRGRQRLRLPCFWFGREIGVLPAFGSFTGTAAISPALGDRVYAIVEKEIIAIPNGRV